MALWNAKEIQAATGGALHGKKNWQAGGISIDSRTVQEGDIFVAITGERVDGHDYIANALQAGAVAAIVDRIPKGLPQNASFVVVEDTTRALQDIGRAARKRSKAKIIGVTGSVGKTSTKEMLNAVWGSQKKTFATSGNYNNHYGLPLILARMPRDTEIAVLEMGMNHAGEITFLAEIAKPHIAIITTVEAVHLEFFTSVAEIAQAKAEIFKGVVKGGTAILPYDNTYYDLLRKWAGESGIAHILAFGTKEGADCRLLEYSPEPEGGKVKADIQGKKVEFTLGLPGRHMAINALAVLASVLAGKGNMDKAMKALAKCTPAAGRGRTEKITIEGKTIFLIDDSYNASPASVTAALQQLGTLKKNRKGRAVAALGDMFELGKEAPALHRGLAQVAMEEKIDKIFAAGKNMQQLFKALPKPVQGVHGDTPENIATSLLASLEEGDMVLVKGSRGMRMEKIIQFLKERADAV